MRNEAVAGLLIFSLAFLLENTNGKQIPNFAVSLI